MAQCSTKTVKIKSILARKEFRLGYEDALNGFGFRKEYEKYDTSEQWTYERGRLFAVASKGAVKIYNKAVGRGRPAVRFEALFTFASFNAEGIFGN